MATITKRGETYRIRVSCGYQTGGGKQIIRSMTYRPQANMSVKAIEKELNRQAVLFEQNCKQRIQSVTNTKFHDFAQQWFEVAALKLKRNTLISYRNMQKRVYAAIGHIRITKLTPVDIQNMVHSLVAEGLAPRTVKGHVRLVSVILNHAIKNHILTHNVCTSVTYPMPQEITQDFYSVEEVKKLLELLRDDGEESTPFAMFFTLAAYTGCRRGELLGFEWKDIDFDNDTIAITRAYYYDAHRHEYFTDTPKNKKSRRSLKLPTHVMQTLGTYRRWQNHRREACGNAWVQSDRLFTKQNGEPMSPITPYNFLTAFCKRVGMRRVSIHSFRHFNASALISNGVDVVAVQTALGHSTAATTLSIYSHAFSSAQARAMEAISNAIDL